MTGWGGMLRGGRSKGKAFAHDSAVPERKPPVPTQKSLKETKNKVRWRPEIPCVSACRCATEVAQRYFPLEPNSISVDVFEASM